MLAMALAGALLLLTHFGLSSAGVRGRMVAALGPQPFLGVYSLVAAACFVLVIWVYGTVDRTDYFWYPDPTLYMLTKVLMPIATIFVFGGFLVPNPSTVGMEKTLDAGDDAVRGILRITRHPFQWGVILWAVNHLISNGDAVSVVFFTTFLILSGAGTVVLDRKKSAQLGDAWDAFAASTSNVPFGAILRGRNKLVIGELILPIVVGLGVYAAFYFGHEWLSGVSIT